MHRSQSSVPQREVLYAWTDFSPNGLSVVHMFDLQLAPLTQVIDEVLEPSIRLRVARLLVRLPEKEFTGREIAGTLGVSHSNVQRAMRVLVEDGFASRRRLGRADIFRVNKEHFLFRTLKALFALERDLPERIREELRSQYEPVALSVVVFGSYARGTADRESDLDVLVATDKPEEAERRTPAIVARFSRKYGLPLSVKIVRTSELKKKKLPPFIREALREGVLVSGLPLRKMIAVAE